MPLSERVQDLLARLLKAEEAIRSEKADETVAVGPAANRTSELHRVILEGMSDGVLALSEQGQILFSNQRFATLVETPLETVIGSRIHDFVIPADLAVVAGLLRGDSQGQSDLRLRASQSTIPTFFNSQSATGSGAGVLPDCHRPARAETQRGTGRRRDVCAFNSRTGGGSDRGDRFGWDHPTCKPRRGSIGGNSGPAQDS